MEDPELRQMRENLKRALDINHRKSPAMRNFHKVDHVLRMITRRTIPYPWYISVVALALIAPLPTVILCFLLKETEQWDALGLIWIGYLEHAVASLVLVSLGLRYVLRSFREHVVDDIETKDNLEHFAKAVSNAWISPHYKLFTTVFTVFWSVTFSLANSIYIGQFIGIGLAIGTLIYGILISSVLYTIGWVIYINPKLGLYKYRLNNVAPYQSEIIFHLSGVFKSVLYLMAVWFFFSTLIVSFNNLSLILVLFIAWIPTIILFFENQSTLKKIITTAKWATLNDIQRQIQQIQLNNITEKGAVEKVSKLMDLSDRIWATPNSTFDMRTGLSLLNQLALPLLGFIIANSSYVLSLFR